MGKRKLVLAKLFFHEGAKSKPFCEVASCACLNAWLNRFLNEQGSTAPQLSSQMNRRFAELSLVLS